MSMVLVVRYEDEPLCADERFKNWFAVRGVSLDDNELQIGTQKVLWNNMRKVNSLMFTIDVDNDEDFPPILFDYVAHLENKDTIVSLAEESVSGYELIYEANLKRFQEELLSDE